MKLPKVSIILTSFNHERFIRESIESALNQTFSDYELILADDCSQDSSWSIINTYKDRRIKLFRSERTEPGLINKVLKSGLVQGEYVAIHHSDDVWELDKLEKQVRCLDADKTIAAVFSKASIIDEDGRLFQPGDDNQTAKMYIQVFDKKNRSRHEWLNYFFHHGNCLCHPSLLIRKECYEINGLYDTNYIQLPDFDFWIRLLLKKEIMVLQEALVRFRVLKKGKNTSAQTTDKKNRVRFESYRTLKHFFLIQDPEKILKIFPNAKKYEKCSISVPEYLLARTAIDSNIKEARLLGLEVLADLMADEKTRTQCLESHNFSATDYFYLTGNTNIFTDDISENACGSEIKQFGGVSTGGVRSRIVSDIRWWKKNWRGRLKNLTGVW